MLPNLTRRNLRQPNTPNPSGDRGYMRLRSLQAEEGDFEAPISERSQGTASNRGGGGDGLQRNTSRRSLLEPLRAGEEIYSPPGPPGGSLATRTNNNMMIRPPVPVEPLAPISEEVAPSVGI